VARRVRQELGLSLPLTFLYKFEYRAEFETLGTEHELCHVYAGVTRATPVINTTEIAAWRWIAPTALDAALAADAERFTPWFHLEWRALRTDQAATLARLLGS
jgi:isopentenyl-diphosphate delta-isomerase